MSEWQPIETAPRDGTIILAWRYYMVAMRWDEKAGDEFPWEAVQLGGLHAMKENGYQEEDLALTHWMSLPEPPK